MTRARLLAVLVLLLSYGAVGARQPAVRTSVPLPAPAGQLAAALDLPAEDRSRLVLDIVRLIFDTPDGQDTKDAQLRAALNTVMQSAEPGEPAPLPLDPSIWREAVFKRDVPDARLLAEILSDRRTALLYHGLSALDDETLGWLGPERGVLEHLLTHAGPFAAYARSLQIRGGRVVVPGGPESDAIWESIVGASPSRPAPFVRRLFSNAKGRTAYFFDAVAHLDEARQRFALAATRTSGSRAAHVRALARVFERSFGELRPAERPFARHPVDPALTLAAVAVTPQGNLVGPIERGLWETVFGARSDPLVFTRVTSDRLARRADSAPIDGAWLTDRVLAFGYAASRSRLETFLFAQRMFPGFRGPHDADVATALRGMLAFPALMLTLERCGITSPRLLADAALRADSLDGMSNTAERAEAIRLFQSSLGIIDRAVAAGGLTLDSARALIGELVAVDLSAREGRRRFAAWAQRDLLTALAPAEADDSAETIVLSALAGVNRLQERDRVVEWEGRRYRVSPELAELERLRRVRTRQGGPLLDDALTAAAAGGGMDGARALGDVLTSILYAIYLGDPEGRILSADNVALRHELALNASSRARPNAPWRFAVELHDRQTGWRLSGSLLGLEVPLSRFALRRMDLTTMPPPPKLAANEMQTAALTVALMRANGLTDDVRTEIAEALARGRARLAALSADREQLGRVARDAGLGAWRRESLGWALTNDPESVDRHLSLVELMWLGAPRPAALAALDAWGAAAMPLTGCLCLAMPTPGPWEFFGGRPSIGLHATRGADVALLLAREFTALDLPASLVPAVLGFAMQDVLDATRPAYFDDWSEFGRAVHAIPRERVIDYVAALTAGGPLLPDITDDRP